MAAADGVLLEPNAAHQPKHDKHDDDQPENSTQAGQPIAAVRVISAAAAEEQDEHNDDDDQRHETPVWSVPLKRPAARP